MSIDQWIKNSLGDNEKVVIDYPDGGFFVANKEGAFIKYNTGDCVYFKVIDGSYRVSKIDTHDDLFYET
jgi:hypothetical protein